MKQYRLSTLAKLSVATVALLTASSSLLAQGVIKIGEINSYKAQPAFLEPYKKGMELAIEQINAGGGLNGKKVELITRDDNANPGDAVRVAEELVSRDKVDVLTGSFLSHIGLALTDFAKQKKVFFLASEPFWFPRWLLAKWRHRHVLCFVQIVTRSPPQSTVFRRRILARKIAGF